MRDFYTAALKAGGSPNGAPATRGDDGCLFNAAILDLDGNSIEVIYREDAADHELDCVSRSRVLTWRRCIDNPGSFDNARSAMTARTSKSSLSSIASSTTESIVRSQPPEMVGSAPGASAVSIAVPSPDRPSGLTSKTVIGTLLGAAAGAAVAYAMVKSEQDSARDEAAFEMAMRSKNAPPVAQKAPSEAKSVRPKSHRNYSTTESHAPPSVLHRNYSVTNSEFSAMPKTMTQLALEAAPEPVAIDQVDTRSYHSPTYVSLAPTKTPTRAPTGGQSLYMPASAAPSRAPSQAPSQPGFDYIPASVVSQRPSIAPSRAATMPMVFRGDPLPQSRQIEDAPSRQPQAVERDWAEEDLVVARRDSAMSVASSQTSKSKHSTHSCVSKQSSPSLYSEGGRSHRSERREQSEDRQSRAGRVRDLSESRSIVSSSSYRSHRNGKEDSRDRKSHASRHSHRSRYASRDRDESSCVGSEASTIRPSRLSQAPSTPMSRKTSVVSAKDIELPESRKTSIVSARDIELPQSRKTSVISTREPESPQSRKGSYISAMGGGSLPGSRKTSHVSAVDMPLPESRKTSVVSGMQPSISGADATEPRQQSRAGSIIGSILGRDSHSNHDNASAANVPLPESKAGTGSALGSMLARSEEPSSGVEYADTVVPDDSISCVASRRHRERNASPSRSPSPSRERSSKSSHHRHRRDRSRESKKSSSSRRHRHSSTREDSLPPLPASEAGSVSTVTPGKSRKDSAISMPISVRSRKGIEKDEKKGKRSIVSAVLGY